MKRLIPLLESVKYLGSKNYKQNDKLSDMLYEAEKNSEKADPKLVSIFNEVKKHDELSIFNNSMEVIGNGASRVYYSSLIYWLITRSSIESVEIAIQDLKKYLSKEKIPFLNISAISGLKIEKSCNLANGIQLIPWDSFPDSYSKEFINSEFRRVEPFHFPSAVLVKECFIKLSHIYVSQDKKNKYWQTNSFAELHDALLCISLVGPVSPYIVINWWHPPEWAPILGVNFSGPSNELMPLHRNWALEGFIIAQKLHKAFIGLSDKDKSAIRISMERLSLAMRRISLVDAAIDLGIALESIFLNDTRAELKFRLRLRASRFLESNFKKRKELYEVFGNLYELRSTAVHSGKLPKEFKKKPIKEILDEGFYVTAKAISKIILDGYPNWTNISLK